MTAIAQASGGAFTVTWRTDPSGLDAAALAQYDAVVFFTCGDLPAAAPLRAGAVRLRRQRQGLRRLPQRHRQLLLVAGVRRPSSAPASSTTAARTCPGRSASRIRTTSRCRASPTRSPSPTSSTCSAARSTTSIDLVHAARPARADEPRSGDADAGAPDAAAGVPAARRRPTCRWPGPASTAPAASSTRPSATGPRRGTTRSSGRTPLAAIRWALFDGDADGLNDRWELTWGLRDYDATGVNGPRGDPDGDGRTNAPGADRRHASARLRPALPGRRRDQRVLRDAHQRPQPQPDVHVPRPAALSDGQRRPCRPTT